jgi:hypothetical protein
MSKSDYPATVLEVIDDQQTYNDAVLQAVTRFAGANPWRGSIEQRQAKFRALHHDLSAACNLTEPELAFTCISGEPSGGSHYQPSGHRIVLVGKLSVVTYLHEFAHALGAGETAACRWSINLFRKCFPTQYGRLVHVGHMLIRPTDLNSQLPRRRDL